MSAKLTGLQGLIVALAIVGCATALTATGHLSSDAWTTIVIAVGTGVGVIASANVAATHSTTAAVSAVAAVMAPRAAEAYYEAPEEPESAPAAPVAPVATTVNVAPGVNAVPPTQ